MPFHVFSNRLGSLYLALAPMSICVCGKSGMINLSNEQFATRQNYPEV